MSYRELYVSSSAVFGGFQNTFREADYVILGAPFDVTGTFRTGTRFAPQAIREASINIETYSSRSHIDVEDLKIRDLGDLHVGGVDETLKRLELVTKDLLKSRKKPIFLGGEHTITLGVMRGVGKNTAVVSFDAHLDLRNEYMGRTISHTTFMRRVHEQMHPKKILVIGTRAMCKEELDYAKRSDIKFFTVQQIRRDGVSKTLDGVEKFLADCNKIYLTVDMDVLDPAFAPAVQNPEPDGLYIHAFLDLVCSIVNHKIVALDLVEVAPHYDKGTTSMQAAKTLFEILCHLEKSRLHKNRASTPTRE